jgi:hypothetical protein
MAMRDRWNGNPVLNQSVGFPTPSQLATAGTGVFRDGKRGTVPQRQPYGWMPEPGSDPRNGAQKVFRDMQGLGDADAGIASQAISQFQAVIQDLNAGNTAQAQTDYSAAMASFSQVGDPTQYPIPGATDGSTLEDLWSNVNDDLIQAGIPTSAVAQVVAQGPETLASQTLAAQQAAQVTPAQLTAAASENADITRAQAAGPAGSPSANAAYGAVAGGGPLGGGGILSRVGLDPGGTAKAAGSAVAGAAGSAASGILGSFLDFSTPTPYILGALAYFTLVKAKTNPRGKVRRKAKTNARKRRKKNARARARRRAA